MKNELVRNRIYFYLACCLSMLVFLPGRFAFGIIILIEFNFLMFAGVSSCYIIKRAGLDSLKVVLYPVLMIFLTILYKQILILICPVAALSIGFCMYLPSLSAAVFEIFFKESFNDYKTDIKEAMSKSAWFSLVALIFFAVRDILGYGTFSLPTFHGIYYIHLPFDYSRVSAGAFLATIPGSFAFVSLAIAVYIIGNEKFLKLNKKNSEKSHEEGEKND